MTSATALEPATAAAPEWPTRPRPLPDGKHSVHPYYADKPEDYTMDVEIADGGNTARVRTADWKQSADLYREEFASCVNAWLYCAIVGHLGPGLSTELSEAISEEVRPPAMPETLTMELSAPFTDEDLMYVTDEIGDALRNSAWEAANDPGTKRTVRDALAAKLAALSAKALEAVKNEIESAAWSR